MLNVHDEGFCLGHAQGKIIMILESSRDGLNKNISTHLLVSRLLVVFAFHVLGASVESV